MLGTGRSADALVHQRSAEIVAACVQTTLRTFYAHFRRRGLDVRYAGMKYQTPNRMHQYGLSKCWSFSGQSFRKQRCLEMDKWEWNKLCYTTRFLLESAQQQEVLCPMNWLVKMPEHYCRSRLETNAMCGRNNVDPLIGLDFVRAKFCANAVVQDFGSGPGH